MTRGGKAKSEFALQKGGLGVRQKVFFPTKSGKCVFIISRAMLSQCCQSLIGLFMTMGGGGDSRKVILHDKGGGGSRTPLKR